MKQFIVEKYTNLNQLLPLRSEWEAMVQQENLTPAHEFDWLKLIWEIHGSSMTPTLLTVRDGSRLVGIAPFVRETDLRKGLKVCLLKPLNAFSLHGTQLIMRGDKNKVMGAIFDYLAEEHKEWDIWSMILQKGEDQALMFESFLGKYGYPFSLRVTEKSPYLLLRGTWEQKIKNLQPRFRTALRSRHRRLSEKGNVELRFLDSPGSWRQGLDAISEIEEASWKASANTAITRDLKQWKFYENYAPLAAAKKTLRLAVLFVAQEPVAYDYALYKDGVYYLLKTSYKTEWENTYPGFVLRKLLIEWLYAHNAKEVDFLGKDDDWKMKWTDTVREHVSYDVFNRKLRSIYVFALHKLSNFAKTNSEPIPKRASA